MKVMDILKATVLTATPPSLAATDIKPTFVFVHGAWHGAWTWNDLTPLLAEVGYASLAIDLPGAGSRTRFPRSFLKRPLDKVAFAQEMSPVAEVTQEERTEATIDAVKQASNLGNGKVVLVGHSWGGLTISHVAEAIPEKIQCLVYLTAMLIPNGLPCGAMFEHPSFETAEALPLCIGDFAQHGALRIDPRSEDLEYVKAAKQAFCHDVSDARFEAIANLLHCDEVASTAGVPMRISPENFGTVERHYIHMADDRTVPPVAQDYMVESVDTSGIGGTTTVHRMSGSHSPFFAKPRELRDVLRKIAG